MKSKHNPIRGFGQRSLDSSFPSRSSNHSKDSEDGVNGIKQRKDSCVSLSDFLDRKLQKNCVPPKLVQGKPKPFLSPLGLRDASGSTDAETQNKKIEEKNNVVHNAVLEQFKHISTEQVGFGGLCNVEVGTSNVDKVKELRKRKNPFEGSDEKNTTQRHKVTVGEDVKSTRRQRWKSPSSNKKPKPLYDHYANGCGWWDCNMEGIDSEEVGFGEVWEGVGSTTFGGIDWR